MGHSPDVIAFSRPELPGLLAGWKKRLAELDEPRRILAAVETKLAGCHKRPIPFTADLALEKLSAARRQESGCRNGAGKVSEIMRQLALWPAGDLEVALLPLATEGAVYGLEQVEFRIGGVAGNAAKPLAKVASGGELSRISLAIQVLTSRSASVPTLIFDEVDVGIGGGVAEIVGRLLRELGCRAPGLVRHASCRK